MHAWFDTFPLNSIFIFPHLAQRIKTGSYIQRWRINSRRSFVSTPCHCLPDPYLFLHHHPWNQCIFVKWFHTNTSILPMSAHQRICVHFHRFAILIPNEILNWQSKDCHPHCNFLNGVTLWVKVRASFFHYQIMIIYEPCVIHQCIMLIVFISKIN